MSKNIIKGAEKCLSQDCQDCELGGRIFMCNGRMNLSHKKRLKQMIDNCISMELSERCEAVNSLLPVVYTLECLGVITNDEAMNYAKRLCREEVKK